jgi:hypothetical protein
MPAKYFKCPDGENIAIADCLVRGCRISQEMPGGRCLSLRTLRLIGEQREWNGVPSTTQLLKGTREAWLELTTDYAIDPQDEIWRVHGTKGHAGLDAHSDNLLTEIRLTDEVNSGQFDQYDADAQTLYDEKFWGSYKIKLAQGLKQIEVETDEVYQRGAKKGQKKTKTEWVEGGEPELFSESLQMNDYRLKLEAAGFPVKTMLIEAFCRDGGTYIADKRGVSRNAVMIPVPRLDDELTKTYFKAKAFALDDALKGNVPPKCNPYEAWDGRKCDRYCRVAERCKELEA